jgi:ketosteroid isomerase-like protein
MTKPSGPVSAALYGYKTAVYDKNIEAFAALYDAEIEAFDMWGDWSCKGIDAWRGIVAGWFGSLGSERVVVGIHDVQAYAATDFAAGHAFLSYTAVSPEGKELRSMMNRITLILSKTAESWKVVHQHTSAPVDFNSMKVTLQR